MAFLTCKFPKQVGSYMTICGNRMPCEIHDEAKELPSSAEGATKSSNGTPESMTSPAPSAGTGAGQGGDGVRPGGSSLPRDGLLRTVEDYTRACSEDVDLAGKLREAGKLSEAIEAHGRAMMYMRCALMLVQR